MQDSAMSIWNLITRTSFLVWFIFLSCFPECRGTQVVTLDSIEIFTKHDWFKSKPTIYFHCKGENKTVLPDVKKTQVLYTFKSQESWQPLTEIQGTKCKRCGFYEQNSLKSDDVFDEWELCPDDFGPGQRHIHYKEKELNATFLCQGCTRFSTTTSTTSDSVSSSGSDKEEENKIKLAIVMVISVVAAIVLVVGVIAVSKYRQRKKRQQDQARFMKLFEDGDELEDGLGTVL